jgi:hypothetical protein
MKASINGEREHTNDAQDDKDVAEVGEECNAD